jgi:hypothetical protein
MLGSCLWVWTLLASGCQREPQILLFQRIPFEEALKVVDRHAAELLQLPRVQGVGLALDGIVIELDHGEVEVPESIEGVHVTIRSGSFNPSGIYPAPRYLAPPAGVLVLRPGGVREAAERCPADFEEQVRYQWRFCLDMRESHPSDIPPLWRPPIAGIPFAEALEIWKRHAAEFMRIAGVKGVILIANGIVVEEGNLAIPVPRSVEGIPVGVRLFPQVTLL